MMGIPCPLFSSLNCNSRRKGYNPFLKCLGFRIRSEGLMLMLLSFFLGSCVDSALGDWMQDNYISDIVVASHGHT